MSASSFSFLIIGSENSRRVRFWEEALRQQKYESNLLPYEQVLAGKFPKISKPTYLRITSPGEDSALQQTLFELGGFSTPKDFVFEPTQLYPKSYWYKGWCLVLRKIEDFITQNSLVKVMNSPQAIRLAFHKLQCQQLLNNRGIKTPQIFIPTLSSYDQLLEKMQKENIHQVFIKPYHGSSASGVMAFRQIKNKQLLYTTIALKSDKLYNKLSLQRYHDPAAIKTIINKMVSSGLLVEEWIRKKTFQRKSVDFRILVINGDASFVVPRISQHIITNLHLGNEKGRIAEVEKEWGNTAIENAKALAVKAVQAIGSLFYAGVDVAVATNDQAYVLEVNAFGDMLLGIEKDSLSTYEYELRALSSNTI